MHATTFNVLVQLLKEQCGIMTGRSHQSCASLTDVESVFGDKLWGSLTVLSTLLVKCFRWSAVMPHTRSMTSSSDYAN